MNTSACVCTSSQHACSTVCEKCNSEMLFVPWRLRECRAFGIMQYQTLFFVVVLGSLHRFLLAVNMLFTPSPCCLLPYFCVLQLCKVPRLSQYIDMQLLMQDFPQQLSEMVSVGLGSAARLHFKPTMCFCSSVAAKVYLCWVWGILFVAQVRCVFKNLKVPGVYMLLMSGLHGGLLIGSRVVILPLGQA